MALNKSKLSPDQKAAFSEARSLLAKAFDDASATLARAGFTDPANDFLFRCTVDQCHCQSFVFTPFPTGACARSGCGHHFIDHDLAQ